MGRRGVYTNHMTARVAVLVLFLFPAGLLAQPGGGDAGIEPEELEKSPPPEEGDKDQLKKELACEKLGNCKTPQDGGQKGDKLLEKKKPGAPKDDDQTALKKKFSKSGVVPKAKLPPAPPPDAPPGETEGVPGGLLRDVEDQAGAPVESGRDREPGSTPPEDAGITSESRARQHRSVGTAARRAENMLRGLNSAQDEPGRGAKPADRPQDQAPQRPQERTQAQPGPDCDGPANLARNPKDLCWRRTGRVLPPGPEGRNGPEGTGHSPWDGLGHGRGPPFRLVSSPSLRLFRRLDFSRPPRDRFKAAAGLRGRPELRHSSFQDVGATERRRDFYVRVLRSAFGRLQPERECPLQKGSDVSPRTSIGFGATSTRTGTRRRLDFRESEAERRESEEAEALRERIGRRPKTPAGLAAFYPQRRRARLRGSHAGVRRSRGFDR